MPAGTGSSKFIHVVVNPAAGQRKAPDFVDDHVIPLLKGLEVPHRIHYTSGIRDAGRIGRIILEESAGKDEGISVLVAGGDGTAHELIEGVLEGARKSKVDVGRWELIVLPLGTANALFHSLFPAEQRAPVEVPSSIQQLLKTTSPDLEAIRSLSSLVLALTPSPTLSPKRLPITLTTLLPPTSAPSSETSPPSPIPSHIVLSTSLHAAILHTSDSLRATHPGLERYQLAASQNLGVFFPATAILRNTSSQPILQYSPKSSTFTTPFSQTSLNPTLNNNTLTLTGPFTYFLSTTTTPRLEPKFVISPLLSRIPPDPADPQTMDITILRPLRDPRVREAISKGEQGGEAWKARAVEVLQKAYKEGEHVDVTYPVEGVGETEVKGEGEVVVEAFRCEGFEWVPEVESDEASHLVCADGSLYHIPPGGKASVEIMRPHESDHGFYVWA